MKRQTWRIALVLATILAALYYLYPTYVLYWNPPKNPDKLQQVKRKSISMGLDLQGGIHLVLQVDPTKLTPNERRDVMQRAQAIITNRVDQFGVTEPIIHREGKWRLVVELPGVADIQRAKELIGQTALLDFKMLKSNADRTAVIDKIEAHLIASAKDTSKAGPGGILKQNSDEEKPGLKQYLMSYGDDLLVPEDRVLTVAQILNRPDVKALIPNDAEFHWGHEIETLNDGRSYRRLYYTEKRAEMTGEIVQDAKVTTGQSFEYAGQPIINFTTTAKGVRIFSRVTGAHVGERMAIILDGKVYSAPTIQVKIRDGRSIITGSKNLDEAKDLAIVLRSGSLPAPMQIVEDRTVGPSLGRDSISEGKRAAAIGLAIVIVFMVIYYGVSGLVADLALLLNLLFILAILAGFHGTLTLPGIAGIILTIGMAVDANVLIYERIREELKSGKTVRTALDNGYDRAFITIVDANLTTIITGVVLYQFGTGPIKGFALTLIVGILSSMFTALFITRVVFDFFISRQKSPSLSVGKLNIFNDTRVDFLKLRRIAFTASSVIILTGLGSTIVKGGYDLGIDFKGGTLLELHFDPAVPVGQIRSALKDVNVNGKSMDLRTSEIKQFGPPTDILIRIEKSAEGTHVADAVKTRLEERFKSDISKNWLRRQEAVGPAIGHELEADAIYAILISLVLIIIYIWWRFQQIEFGIAAVIALFHDVLVTLGVFSLLNKEISLDIVAALLTIVGYSINDTIVIFDRIREDLRLYRRESFGDVINRGINESLNRTTLTSGTTLLAVAALLALGGQVLYDFSFALLIGIITGTYSSDFIASPIVYMWQLAAEKRKPNANRRSVSVS